MKIGIIGAGRVGVSFGKILDEHNLFEKGIAESLTGPVDRGDTVNKHLSVLIGDKNEIYKLLSKKLTEIAEQKNSKDYTVLRKELN